MVKLNTTARLMGLFWLIASLLWALACIAALIFGMNWLNNLETGIQRDIGLVVENIESVQGLLLETNDVLSETQIVLTSVSPLIS